jgi:hypothetical protein
LQILRDGALGIPLLRQHNVVWAAQWRTVAASVEPIFELVVLIR